MITTHVRRKLDRLALEGAERSERGASLVEYALLLVLIAMVCLAAVQFFGVGVNENLSRSASSISSTG